MVKSMQLPEKVLIPLQKSQKNGHPPPPPRFDAYVPADELIQVMTFTVAAPADVSDNEHINTPAAKQTSLSDTCEHV